MKVFTAQCGDEQIQTIWKPGEHRVPIKTCRPNNWNMNAVPPQMYAKLKLVIEETLKEAAQIPSITARPHPKKKRLLQIIDGEHRWKILQELGQTEIDVKVLYVGVKRAKMMTAELNYNRGEPDMERYPQYLANLVREFEDIDPKYLADRLPESESEVKSLLEAADLDIDEIKIDDDDDGSSKSSSKDASDADVLVELKFAVRQGAAEIVERELSRLGSHLGGGKNVRGRSLEMMAVLSSQAPDGSIDSAMEEDDGGGGGGGDFDVSVAKRKRKKRKS